MWAVHKTTVSASGRPRTFFHHHHVDLFDDENNLSTTSHQPAFDILQSTSPLDNGRLVNAFPTCGGFAVRFTGGLLSNPTNQITFSLGERYAVRISRVVEATLASDNGKAGWLTHYGGNVPIQYNRLEILDDNTSMASAISWREVGIRLAGSIVAGFCRVDNELRLCAWHLYTTALSGFGALSLFVSAAVDESDAVDGEFSINWEGEATLFPLATKFDEFEETIPALPLTESQLYERAGKSLCSFTQPVLHILSPRILIADAIGINGRDVGRTAHIDTQNEGQTIVDASLTNPTDLATPCFAVSHSGYEFNSTMPVPVAGSTGNVHPDPAVNELLTRLRLTFGELSYSSDGTTNSAQNVEVVFEPVANALNVWSAEADVQGSVELAKFHGLVSMYRSDTIVNHSQIPEADRFNGWFWSTIAFPFAEIDFSYLEDGEFVELQYDLGSSRSITVRVTGGALRQVISASAEGLGFEVSYSGRSRAYGGFKTGTSSLNPSVAGVTVTGNADGLTATDEQLASLLSFSVVDLPLSPGGSATFLPQPMRSFRSLGQQVRYWILLSVRFQSASDPNVGISSQFSRQLHRTSLESDDDISASFFAGDEVEPKIGGGIKFQAIGPAT